LVKFGQNQNLHSKNSRSIMTMLSTELFSFTILAVLRQTSFVSTPSPPPNRRGPQLF